ncbi:DUF3307 domain-containing protein [Pelagicoccus sp. SDUM812003]|uniref:DUF3307 domain-containing protein n=1 Tax=Pelagicoccus sp. SDUM812003 TaxID=3041267 RepID=UPI00280D186A|nr:DUF3307 domain-containing protein [Pelagicoccus sp. SDUM812003]MDQ8202948.1 DUF3307 domain-containing protein [Pelagicoccus sp. SDUM812003]
MPSFDLTLLIPLLAAHFLSDFALQPDAIARNKQRIGTLLLHILITGLCAYLLLGDFREWRIPLLLAATHGIIDLLKLRLAPNSSRDAAAFVVDQLAHFAIIFAVSAVDWTRVGMLAPWWKPHNPEGYLNTLLFLGGVIAVTQAAGVFISKLLPKLLDTDTVELQSNTGFAKAGRYIGYLERLLLLLFVITGQLAAAGFLIAAKSVFRFQKTQEDRKQTEYVLLGTLLSFTTGIAIAFAIKAMMP